MPIDPALFFRHLAQLTSAGLAGRAPATFAGSERATRDHARPTDVAESPMAPSLAAFAFSASARLAPRRAPPARASRRSPVASANSNRRDDDARGARPTRDPTADLPPRDRHHHPLAVSSLAFVAAAAVTLAPPADLAPPARAVGVEIEVPAALDPWKEGRARKARERAEAQARVDATFRREAEQRAENERLSAAYYAKAAASRRARAAAEREGVLSAAEIDVVAARAGEKAFRAAVEAIDAEEVELRKYEERQRELRETAEQRNAEALAAAKAAEEEAAALQAATDAEDALAKECAEGENPLAEPGTVQCA